MMCMSWRKVTQSKPSCLCSFKYVCFLPADLFFQFGAEQQVSEEEDMPQLPGPLHQLHHEAIPQQLAVLWTQLRVSLVTQN